MIAKGLITPHHCIKFDAEIDGVRIHNPPVRLEAGDTLIWDGKEKELRFSRPSSSAQHPNLAGLVLPAYYVAKGDGLGFETCYRTPPCEYAIALLHVYAMAEVANKSLTHALTDEVHDSFTWTVH